MSGLPEKVEHVSPSQIKTFRDCPRQWGFKYIEGRLQPDTPATLLGKRVHKVLELWLGEGQRPDLNTIEGEIAKVGLHHYPLPKTCDLKVEHEMHFEFDGVVYFGVIDLHYPLSSTKIQVTDHKTTTDFRWMKTEEQLHEDPQAVLYSAWATLKYSIRDVTAKWVYLHSKPPFKSDTVWINWTVDEIWEAMRSVHETAKEIVRSRKLKVMDLQPNLDACGMYRGCPFQDICVGRMSAIDRMKAQLRQEERAELARKLKHEPPRISPAIRQSAVILKNKLTAVSKDNPKEKQNMSLLSKLREDGAKPKTTPPPTTTAAPATTRTPVAGRAPLARAGSAAAPAAGRAPLARAASNATPAAAAAPARGGPLARTGRAPLATKPEPEPEAPEVAENYDPPQEPEPTNEPEPEPTPAASGRRARGPNKSKGDALNPMQVLAEFHMAAIRAGAEPAIAEEHFNAWQAIASAQG